MYEKINFHVKNMFHKTFKKIFLHYKTFIFLGPEDVAVTKSLI